MGLPNFEVFTFVNTFEKKQEEEKMPSDFKLKYFLEDVILGEGATGYVKKCFLKNNLNRKGSLLNIVKDCSYESNMLSTVSHKNIVNTEDFYENEYMNVYIVREYVRDEGLFDFIKSKGPVTKSKARYFFDNFSRVWHICIIME